MTCKICSGSVYECGKVVVRRKYHASLLACTYCKYVCMDPVTWLDDAYSRVIDTSDTGYVARNMATAGFVSALFSRLHASDAYYCDYGAGYGMLVRMMRDRGFKFHYYDKYCDNLFAPYCEASVDLFGTYEAVVACEVFEHVLNPVEELDHMLQYGKVVVFSTETVPDDTSKLQSWSYLGLGHGQHVSFYSEMSLAALAAKYDMTYGRLSRMWHVIGAEVEVIRILRANRDARKKNAIHHRIMSRLGVVSKPAAPRESLTLHDHIQINLIESGDDGMLNSGVRHVDLQHEKSVA